MLVRGPARRLIAGAIRDGPAIVHLASLTSPVKGSDMRALRYLRKNPIVALCIAVAAMIVPVAAELARTGPKNVNELRDLSTDRAVPVIGPPRAVTEEPAPEPSIHAHPGALTRAVLPKLKSGMTRAEVEGLLGVPTADRIHPVTVIDGRMTYRTVYDLGEFDPPQTIRPIQSRLRIPPPPRESQSVVALEFDASRPGHPLIEVLFPDPLF